MRPTRSRGVLSTPIGDGGEDCGVGTLIRRFVGDGTEAKHLDHRATDARDEPVEEVKQHLVVGSDDDGPMQGHVAIPHN